MDYIWGYVVGFGGGITAVGLAVIIGTIGAQIRNRAFEAGRRAAEKRERAFAKRLKRYMDEDDC